MASLELVQTNPRLQLVVGNNTLYLETSTPRLMVLPSTTVTLAADDTIPATYNVIYVAGDGGHVTLTNTPTIAAGTKNQPLTLIGTDDSATVTVQDATNLVGSTLNLEYSRNVILGNNDVLDLIYTGSAWVRRGSSDNA